MGNIKFQTIKIAFLSIAFNLAFFPSICQERLDFAIRQSNELYINTFQTGQDTFCITKEYAQIDSIEITCEKIRFSSFVDSRCLGWDVDKGDGYIIATICYNFQSLPNVVLGFLHENAPANYATIMPVCRWVVFNEVINRWKRTDVVWPYALDITVPNDTIWLLHRRDRAIDLWFSKIEAENNERINLLWRHKFSYLADSVESTVQFTTDVSEFVTVENNY